MERIGIMEVEGGMERWINISHSVGKVQKTQKNISQQQNNQNHKKTIQKTNQNPKNPSTNSPQSGVYKALSDGTSRFRLKFPSITNIIFISSPSTTSTQPPPHTIFHFHHTPPHTTSGSSLIQASEVFQGIAEAKSSLEDEVMIVMNNN